MKRILLLCIATVLMIPACSSTGSNQPTSVPPLATPSFSYQVVGSTKNTFMVVVDPKTSTDRAALQEIGDYLCTDIWPLCKIWFWDDINKADTSYPVDPANEKTLVALYSYNPNFNEKTLVVYALGDK